MDIRLTRSAGDTRLFHERLRGPPEAPSRADRRRFLIHPVRHEDVRFMRVCIVAVGCPNQLPSVSAEHRESIEGGRGGHLLETGTVGVYEKQIEISELRIGVMVRGEDDLLSIRRPRRTKARSTEVSDLFLPASIGVHDP